MRILFVIDALSRLNPKKDSTLALMRAAAEQGGEVYYCELPHLSLTNAGVGVLATALHFSGSNTPQVASSVQVAADFFSLVWMRKEPPVDNAFIDATRLLQQAQKVVTVVNAPTALQAKNEKLGIFDFPQFILPTWVGTDVAAARQFHQQQQISVMKPLDGMGGQGVYVVSGQDKNFASVFDMLSQFGTKNVMLQKYSDKISEGDCRVFAVGGEVLDWMLVRYPPEEDNRGNMAAGGQPVARPIDEAKKQIAQTVATAIFADGVFFAGLDIIGNNLIEINITCPTGLCQIHSQTGTDLATIITDTARQIYISR